MILVITTHEKKHPLLIIIVVVFGATGFTGALTCEYLAEIKDDVMIF